MSLHSCYNSYSENGSKIKTAAKYYNVVYPPLIARYLKGIAISKNLFFKENSAKNAFYFTGIQMR